MASLNKVMLIGRLTRDPERRSTPSGMAVADLGLAVNRRYRTNNGEDREETCFIDVTVWGKQAENCGEYLRKGSPIFVEGHLKMDTWEKDGQKRSKISVVAERVQFLESGGRRDRVDYGDAPEDDPPQQPTQKKTPRTEPVNDVTPTDTLAEDDNLPF